MSKHTPGPWHFGGQDQCTVYDRLQQRVANSFEGTMVTQRSDAECRANACLIASAPELMGALKVLIRDYMAVHGVGDLEMQPALFQASAAIAKAQGEA